MAWFFAFFFISGFCSILYELIWLRLAMAQFGVTTALTSIVLSVFMAGLGIGSLVAGFLIRRYAQRLASRPIQLYVLAELLIGISAIAVPLQLAYGHQLIIGSAGQSEMSSLAHYLASGVLLAVTLIPWCSCMGATIPFAMFAIRSDERYESRRSFSFLYLANVLGAVAGAVISPLLIELYGFHATLNIGAMFNALIAACAMVLSLTVRKRTEHVASDETVVAASDFDSSQGTLLLLFFTGLTSMGMELVWIRLFTPYVGPVVYSFAGILASYLVATFLGSRVYRFWRWGRRESELVWIALVPLGMLPLLTADARFGVHFSSAVRVFFGVAPFAALLGFLTPMLVDRWSRGDPERAARAYAVNVLGCILGPLFCGFLLLPFLGERGATMVLSLPWAAMLFRPRPSREPRFAHYIYGYATVALGVAILFLTRDFSTQYPESKVLRDSTATVIAAGSGMEKRLLVNGIGMTKMRPVTKMMAHLTLSSLGHDPRNALIICFGMGTTFRSAMSWGIPTTVVDLVPSVPALFTYFHPDSAELLKSPHAHVIVDDGRRFLERSRERYDVIIIDPPPPVQVAGSSLLYSGEFYSLAKQRLQPDGILEQWLPSGDYDVKSSVTQAIQNSFPHVRIFQNDLTGMHGWHFLASSHPIPVRTAQDMVAKMPASAVSDMMEWGPETKADQQIQRDLSHELKTSDMIALSPQVPPLSDDKPVNEYYLLRETKNQWFASRNNTVVTIRGLLAKGE